MDTTARFSDRVEDYVKYRPHYPARVRELLDEKLGLGPESVVADLGAGTGIFSELLLDSGATVFAVEPNAPMRQAAERRLAGVQGFRAVAGTAEDTTLKAETIDIVTAAQAFHWFDPGKTRKECLRILKPVGAAALVWNDRRTSGSEFLAGYERMLEESAVDYNEVKRVDREEAAAIRAFFGAQPARAMFANYQELDREALRGRLLSSSYAPKPGHPKYEPIMKRLDELFARHQKDGRVKFEYETVVYYGHLK
jgi:SAM-dependent methyltransferase